MNWITKRRKELDITQDQLAARLQISGFEISRAAISAWESGRNTPPLDDAEARQAMAKALKLSVSEMLTLAGYEIKDAPVSDEARKAAAIVERLPASAKELALEYLNLLEKKYVS